MFPSFMIKILLYNWYSNFLWIRRWRNSRIIVFALDSIFGSLLSRWRIIFSLRKCNIYEIIPMILESYYYFLRSSRLKYQHITGLEFEEIHANNSICVGFGSHSSSGWRIVFSLKKYWRLIYTKLFKSYLNHFPSIKIPIYRQIRIFCELEEIIFALDSILAMEVRFTDRLIEKM